MSTTQTDLPLLNKLQTTTPFTRDVWLSIIRYLDNRSLTALFLTNKALNDLLVLKMIELELLFPQPPNDRRTPFEYLTQESSERYKELQAKFPIAYSMTWAALYEDFDRFVEKLEEFKNIRGNKWPERLQVEKAPGHPLPRVILERGNRQFFYHLYDKNHFPINLRFPAGNSVLSYALIYNNVEVAHWLFRRPELEVNLNDLIAAIISPHENVALFEQVLKKCHKLLHEELLNALITAIEEKKDEYVRCLAQYGVRIGHDVPKIVDDYSREQHRFDLIYNFHRCVETLAVFRTLNLPACTVVDGEMPADTAHASMNRTHYGSLLRIATLYAPRDKVVGLVRQLLTVKEFDVSEDFREGKLLQFLLEQQDTPITLLRILIDASAEYYDQMPPNETSLYRSKLFTTLLKKCERGFSHDDTMRIARHMIRRWNRQLSAGFFAGKASTNPALYGGRVTAKDLLGLSQFHKNVSQITEALRNGDTKRLKHFYEEIFEVFDAIQQDVLERKVGVGSKLTGFEEGMIEDAKNSTPLFECTHRFLRANRKKGLTSDNIIDELVARKRTVFNTYVGWEFVLDPVGLAVLRERPDFQNIDALIRWVELYISYERPKSGSAEKCEDLEKALTNVKMYFPRLLLSKQDLYDPKQLVDCLTFNVTGSECNLRDAIRQHRDKDKSQDKKEKFPRGWYKLLECFEVMAQYIEKYPEQLENNRKPFVPESEKSKKRGKPLKRKPVSKAILIPRDQEAVLDQQRVDDHLIAEDNTTSFSY